MAEQIINKRCSHCKQTKPISEFRKNRTRKDKHQDICKLCQLKYQRDYRQTKKGKACANRYRQSEKGKDYQKTYQALYSKSEKYKAYKKRYSQTEKFKIAQKRYRQSEKGKDCYHKKAKQYAIRHQERRKAKSAVNNAIKCGKLPRPDTLHCSYCPNQAKLYHHHKGYEPKHWLDVIPVCIKCHTKIHKKTA